MIGPKQTWLDHISVFVETLNGKEDNLIQFAHFIGEETSVGITLAL